jgi:hypothetical protein
MPKQDVLKLCETAIKKDLDNLDDLPYELANTVANVYYRYFDQSLDVMKRASNNPGWLPREVKRENDILEGITSFANNVAKFKSDIESVPGFIEGLREIDRQEQPNLYKFAVDFILDILKYDIKDAQKKTGLRRIIERKIRKGKIQEIPNLVDLLGV